MSISSWLRMWQCHTYSQPKLMVLFVIGRGQRVALRVGVEEHRSGEPAGIIGLSGRTELGTSKGTCGMIGRSATMVSSSGLIRTVSFQPFSFASFGMMMLSHVTRLSTWTSYRWKWIGWVSTPLWVTRQICVPSVASLIGVILTS